MNFFLYENKLTDTKLLNGSVRVH